MVTELEPNILEELKKGLPLCNGHFRLPCWELYKATSGFYCVYDHNGSKKFINLKIKRYIYIYSIFKKNNINWFEYPDVYVNSVLFEKHTAKYSKKQYKVIETEERYVATKAFNEPYINEQ